MMVVICGFLIIESVIRAIMKRGRGKMLHHLYHLVGIRWNIFRALRGFGCQLVHTSYSSSSTEPFLERTYQY